MGSRCHKKFKRLVIPTGVCQTALSNDRILYGRGSVGIRFSIQVNNTTYNYTIKREVLDLSTLGWLKNEVIRTISTEYNIIGDLVDFTDSMGRKYESHCVLGKIARLFPDYSEINLLTKLIPREFCTSRIFEKLYGSRESLKHWVNDVCKLSTDDFELSFCEDGANGLLEAMRTLYTLWCAELQNLTLVCGKAIPHLLEELKIRRIDLRGNFLQSNVVEFIKGTTVIDLSFNPLAAPLSAILSSLTGGILSLRLVDCDLIIDSMGALLFNGLAELDLSFNILPDIRVFLDSLAVQAPNLQRLTIDGVETLELVDNRDLNFHTQLNSLHSLSVGFFRSGLIPFLVIKSVIGTEFCGSIIFRHSNLLGYEDRIRDHLRGTHISDLDTTGVVGNMDPFSML
jgi:hypothetical protein